MSLPRRSSESRSSAASLLYIDSGAEGGAAQAVQWSIFCRNGPSGGAERSGHQIREPGRLRLSRTDGKRHSERDCQGGGYADCRRHKPGLAWMPPLRHWPRNPEPFTAEDSEIFNWMLENPRIIEALDGVEGAKLYRALHGMLDSARAKRVVLFNKETRQTAGAALYQTHIDASRALSQRERPKTARR